MSPSRLHRAGVRLALVLLPAVAGAEPARGQEPVEGRAAAAAPSLAEGGWMGEAGGDRFVFELRESPGSGLTGVVHSLRAGRKYGELPVTDVRIEGDRVRLTVGTAGVALVGQLDLASRRIHGALEYPGGGGMPMDLTWVEPDTVPGLRARPAASAGAAPYAYAEPPESGDGWRTGSIAEAGLPVEGVEALMEEILGGGAGVLHALLVVHDGRLVVEEYFHGYGRDDLHPVASVTKSVASLLVGAAVSDGRIPGVETRLAEFFPDDADLFRGGMAEVTLGDLLTMTMDLDWSAEDVESVHGSGPAFFRRVLSRESREGRGSSFRYVSAQADLLAGVLRQATGDQADAYAVRRLFGPLGIRRFDWSAGNVDGYPQMDGTLELLPRDMARLGQLVLDGGVWNGEPLIAREWIAASTTARVATGEPWFPGYGYLWWTGRLPGTNGEHAFALANGWGSQFLLVVPELRIAVVTTGGNQDNGRHLSVLGLLVTHLLGTR